MHPSWSAAGDREELRRTFDRDAAGYDAARPDYPDAIFDDLLALTGVDPASAALLEVGCGTGKATRPLAARGFSIVALELGAHLAAVARRHLEPYPRVQVVGTSFEAWDPGGRRFDLVYAATAWHWVDPAVRYAKAAAVLRPEGHLAFWGAAHGFPVGFDPFFTEIQEVYDSIGESAMEWPPPTPDDWPDDAAEVEASGLFEPVSVRRYLWARTYTADEYVALLETFSGHILMAPAAREVLYGEVRRRLGSRADGRVLRHWQALLHVARRRPERKSVPA